MSSSSANDSNAPSRHITSGAVRAWRAMLKVHAARIEELARLLKAEHGLSISDFDVLINIAPHESVRHRDLSERVVLSRTALSRLVDRLIMRGYLTRTPDDTDSRGVRIALTDDGRRVREAAGQTNDASISGAFSVLDAHDLESLTTLMNTLGAGE